VPTDGVRENAKEMREIEGFRKLGWDASRAGRLDPAWDAGMDTRGQPGWSPLLTEGARKADLIF